MNIQSNNSITSRHKNNPRRVDMPLKLINYFFRKQLSCNITNIESFKKKYFADFLTDWKYIDLFFCMYVWMISSALVNVV